jgi:hypothetical protein
MGKLRIACCILLIGLSLALLEAGVLFVDDVQFALSAYDFAICTSLFNRCSHFHDSVIYI